MYFGRCVIASRGPGMSDVFADEVIIVPPEDPYALAAAIEAAWIDDDLRGRVAAAGQRYAIQAGGETRLHERIIVEVLKVLGS